MAAAREEAAVEIPAAAKKTEAVPQQAPAAKKPRRSIAAVRKKPQGFCLKLN